MAERLNVFELNLPITASSLQSQQQYLEQLLDIRKATKELREANASLNASIKATAKDQSLSAASREAILRRDRRQYALNEEKIREMGKSVRNLRKDFVVFKAAEGSITKMKEQLDKLNREFEDMGPSIKRGQVADRIKRISGEIDRLNSSRGRGSIKGFSDQFNAAMSQMNGGWGQLTGLVKGGLPVAAAVVGIQEVMKYTKQWIDLNARVSDSLADVRKTTGLAGDELENLLTFFKSRDTRTDIFGQLEIAKIGGQLGVAKEEISGFTEAIDRVKVALGEELGDNTEKIASDLGKLNEILDVQEEFGVAEGIERIGSAINELGATETAKADFIVSFSRRIAGIAPLAKISADEVLALAATMDVLGQRDEASSTAISKFLIKIGQDVEGFAKIAGLSKEAFSSLLEQSGIDALLAVLNNVKKTGVGLEALTKRLEQFGIRGIREIQTIGALSENVEVLERTLKTSADAFRENTSVLNEFDIKNQTLAASIEKTWNALTNRFINSGFSKHLQRAFELLAGSLRPDPTAVQEFEEASKRAFDSLQLVNPLIDKFTILKSLIASDIFKEYTPELQAKKTKELQDVINEIVKIVPEAGVAFNELGEATDIDESQIKKITTELQKVADIKAAAAANEIRESIDKKTKSLARASESYIKHKKVLEEAFSIENRNAVLVAQKAVEKYKEELEELETQLERTISGQNQFLEAFKEKSINELHARFLIEGGFAELGAKQIEAITKARGDVIKKISDELSIPLGEEGAFGALEERLKGLKAQIEDLAASKGDKSGLPALLREYRELEAEIKSINDLFKGGKGPFERLQEEQSKLGKSILDNIANQRDQTEEIKRYQELTEKIAEAREKLNKKDHNLETIKGMRGAISDINKELNELEGDDPALLDVIEKLVSYDSQLEQMEGRAKALKRNFEELETAGATGLNIRTPLTEIPTLDFKASNQSDNLNTDEIARALALSQALQDIQNKLNAQIIRNHKTLGNTQAFLVSAEKARVEARIESIKKTLALGKASKEEEAKLLEELADLEIDLAVKTYEFKKALRKKELSEEEQDLRENIIKISTATEDALLGFNALNQANDAARYNAEIEALEKRYAREIELAQGNKNLIKKLEEERDDRKAQIERRAFERQKRYQKTEATISYFTGLVRILSSSTGNPLLDKLLQVLQVIALTTQYAASVKNIEAQKFAKGVVLKGPSHNNGGVDLYSPSGHYYGEAEGGEVITTKATSRDPRTLGVLSYVNKKHGGRDFGGVPMPDHIASILDEYLGRKRISGAVSFTRVPQMPFFASGTVLSSPVGVPGASIDYGRLADTLIDGVSKIPAPVVSIEQLERERDRYINIRQNGVIR